MYKIQEKLDEIIKNQEILNEIQVAIYDLLLRIESKMPSGEKTDIAGTITAELGLVDILNEIKKG
jgi:hypothetical protein